MPHDGATGVEDEWPLMARGKRASLFVAVVSLGITTANASELPLLPMPASVHQIAGSFAFAHARIGASDIGERAAANRLLFLLEKSGGPRLGVGASGAIQFRHDATVAGDEAYRLNVTPTRVEVSASSDAGLFYGAETLWQLMASSKSRRIARSSCFQRNTARTSSSKPQSSAPKTT